MKHAFIISAVFIWMACPASGAEFFQSLHYPGALNTSASGIYENKIVGTYWDDFESQHGFIYDGSVYTTLDFPGSTSTTLTDVDGTRFVGHYRDASGVLKGFLFENNSFVTISPPDTTNLFPFGSSARGISGNNIVGFYNVDGGGYAERHGYIYDGSAYATLDYPTGIQHIAEGIEGNRIVGQYLAGNIVRGYYYDGSTFSDIDHPLGNGGTVPTAISGNKIVGWHHSSLTVSGFIYEAGRYTSFNALGLPTTFSGVWGNRIVGTYFDTRRQPRGFLLIIPETSSCFLFAIGFSWLVNHRRWSR